MKRMLGHSATKARRWRYREADIQLQQRQLKSYDTGIVRVTPSAPIASNRFAVFVHYAPQTAISPSSLRALRTLRTLDVNIVFVANHELQAMDLATIEPLVHSVMVRNNQGFDFGAYKDATRWLIENEPEIDRLILANDSVFYGSQGLEGLFSALLGPEDVIAAHENWGEDHHLQSFLLSMSGDVLTSEAVRRFWAAYAPVNNRIHAIESGEKELSRALLKAAQSTRVVYSAAALYTSLMRGDVDLASRLVIFPNPWRTWIEAMDAPNASTALLANKVIDIINVTSTIHAGAYLFPKALGSPLFKKDLVYRQRFEFWEVESWIRELLNDEESAEYLTLLRKKRDASALMPTDRRRFDIGVL